MAINLAFLTGARSEYGVARPLLRKLDSDTNFNLLIFPNGMHLQKEFGYTLDEIKKDGLTITETISTYNSIKEKSYQFSNSVKCIYDVLKKYSIDIVYIIGDRIEAYSAALSAHFLGIPIAHFGGGTITEGALDNIYRYNITNLSYFHFATSKNNYQRLLECTLTVNENVFFTGSTAINGIMKFQKNNIWRRNNNKEINNYALMTFHPVTLGNEPTEILMDIAIDYIIKTDCNILITYPNNDNGYEAIIKVINKWKSHEKIKIKDNLGAESYYEALENSLFVIGNSSSGLIEAPYFNKPVIMVGSRQNGRDKDVGVFEVPADSNSLTKVLIDGFKSGWEKVDCNNLYGDGNAVNKIIELLKTIKISRMEELGISKLIET